MATSATDAATSADARGRIRWMDVAKGVCILLVVLHHTEGKHLRAVLSDHPTLLAAWQDLDAVFVPMRMPLFFLISGMLAAGAVARPWGAVLGRRVISPYWVYTVWLSLHVAAFVFVDRLPLRHVKSVTELGSELLFAATGLWYLYALVAYFVVAKLLSPFPAPVVLAGAALLSAVVPLLPVESANQQKILASLVFYLVGASYPRLVGRLRRLPNTALVALLVGYAGAWGLLPLLGVPPSLVLLAAAPMAIGVGVQLAFRLETTPVGPALAALGSRTLPVYVMHLPLLGLLHQAASSPATAGFREAATAAVPVPVLALYPLLAVAVVVGACLLAHRLLVSLGFGFLFSAPEVLTGPWAGARSSVASGASQQQDDRGGAGPARGDQVVLGAGAPH